MAALGRGRSTTRRVCQPAVDRDARDRPRTARRDRLRPGGDSRARPLHACRAATAPPRSLLGHIRQNPARVEACRACRRTDQSWSQGVNATRSMMGSVDGEVVVASGTRLTDEERAQIAVLAATGLPGRLIASEIGRSHRAVWSWVVKLRQPPAPPRRRSPLRLSLAEREEISRGLASGESLRGIAARLGRAPSTVSREVKIAGGRRRYRACRADIDALARARRPKLSKLATCERLRAVVEARLEQRWSPEQIAGRLGEEFPDDPEMRVSHETIYLSLFVQAQGALRKELARYLRTGRVNRRPLGHSVMNGQGQLRGTVNISERPAEADSATVPNAGSERDRW